MATSTASAGAPTAVQGVYGTGNAAILSIGTANPDNVVLQDAYPDYYFRICTHHNTTTATAAIKDKFRAISEKSGIRKRHLHLTEKMLKNNPSMCHNYGASSLDARQHISLPAVVNLAAEAATKALAEWGRPWSEITHLIFCTTVGADMPGADLRLLAKLGLPPATIQRFMFYHLSCYAGGSALRLAKDIVENNNPGSARVLLVCSEIFNVHNFRGPAMAKRSSSTQHDDDVDYANLCLQATTGDGAAALVVGSYDHHHHHREKAPQTLFEIISATPYTLVDKHAVDVHVSEAGITFRSSAPFPKTIEEIVEGLLRAALEPLGGTASVDWNRDVFWAMHPGMMGLLDRLPKALLLEPAKLDAASHVFQEYGYMLSCTTLFILDEIRRHSAERHLPTTGEGCRYGVLLVFGPGVTIEMVLLRSIPLPPTTV